MSSKPFCCAAIQPYRPQRLSHESKFTSFLSWAAFPRESRLDKVTGLDRDNAPFAIQLVQQVNYGPLKSKRYFIPHEGAANSFGEVGEDDLIRANFQKLNSYKNYKCDCHNKFFELNVYQKDPVNEHHWRSNLARPAREIDLTPRVGRDHPESSMAAALNFSVPHESTTKLKEGQEEIANGACRLRNGCSPPFSLRNDVPLFSHCNSENNAFEGL